jgi:hypothetical protein
MLDFALEEQRKNCGPESHVTSHLVTLSVYVNYVNSRFSTFFPHEFRHQNVRYYVEGQRLGIEDPYASS